MSRVQRASDEHGYSRIKRKGNLVRVQSSAPLNPFEGMEWFDTDDNSLKIYDGSDWQYCDYRTVTKTLQIPTPQDAECFMFMCCDVPHTFVQVNATATNGSVEFNIRYRPRAFARWDSGNFLWDSNKTISMSYLAWTTFDTPNVAANENPTINFYNPTTSPAMVYLSCELLID